MKRQIYLPKGTCIDLGTIARGNQCTLVCPNGTLVHTSSIQKYFISPKYCMIETVNSIYILDNTN